MDPMTIASLLGTGISAGSSIYNMFRNRGQQQRQGMPQSIGGMRATGMPGGSTAVQMPRFTQGQQGGLESMLQQGLQGMGNLPSAEFGPLRKMYEQQFNQQVIPGIAEQFTGAGAGSQRSSAFEQALGGAGAGLQTQLAGMEQQFNMQNRQSEIGRLMQMLQMGFQPQFEYGITPPKQGWLSSLMGGAGQGLGMMAPMAGMWAYNKFGGGQ